MCRSSQNVCQWFTLTDIKSNNENEKKIILFFSISFRNFARLDFRLMHCISEIQRPPQPCHLQHDQFHQKHSHLRTGPHACNLDFIILFSSGKCECAFVYLLSVLVSLSNRDKKNRFLITHNRITKIHTSLWARNNKPYSRWRQRHVQMKISYLTNKWQSRHTNGITAISPRDFKGEKKMYATDWI